MTALPPSILGPVRIKTRFTGASGPPATMASGEISFSAVDGILSIGIGDDGTGTATSILSIGGAGAMVARTLLGAANGVATLGSDGKIPTAQIPAALLGTMQYQGVWNAATNTPALASGVGVKGQFYKVSVAGSTALDGYSKWQVGDIVLFDGTTWDGIDGNQSEVQSVAGRTGMVTLTSADLTDATATGRAILAATGTPAARTALLVDGVATVADANTAVTPSTASVLYNTLTAPRVVSLPALATMNPGQRVRVRDNCGGCSSTNTLTITPNGSEKIIGLASLALSVAWQDIELEASGSQWSVIAIYPPFPVNTTGGVNAGQY